MRSGFTILEVLLSLAIIAILAAVSVPVLQSFQTRNDLDIATFAVVQAHRRAQSLARASEGDTSWGVYATSGSITVFRGASFVLRATDFDEVFEIPTNMLATGTLEVVYASFSGLANASSSLVLTSIANETRTITLNEKGTVAY